MKAAKALGLEMLLRADEVIEEATRFYYFAQ
jgi:hypothetical protein